MFIKEVDVFRVSKDEVIRKDIRKLSKKIEKLKCKGSKSKGKLYVYFDSFASNPEKMFEAPEVEAYVKKLYKKHPYFIYFIDKTMKSDILLLSYLSSVRKVIRKDNEVIDVDIRISDEIKLEIITAVLNNCWYNGETVESLEEELESLMYF